MKRQRPGLRTVTLALCVTAGCGKRAEDAPVPLRFDAELGRSFELASGSLQPSEATAPDAPLRWRTPACELEYQLRASIEFESVHEGRSAPSSGLRIEGSWKARAEGQRMILRNGDVTLAHTQGGLQRPGIVQPGGTLAEIRLETDGWTWTEVDGPTTLWSAYGSWSGITLFYPTLVDGTQPGTQAEGSLLLHELGAGVRVELERGTFVMPEGTPLPEVNPSTVSTRVELQRWLDIEGARAVVVRARSEQQDRSGAPFGVDALFDMLAQTDASNSSQSQFVVLESGVLLHAELLDRTDVQIDVRTDVSMRQLHTLRAEARLVRGCGGPVLPEFVDERSPAELALAAVSALRDLAAAGELEALEAQLSPKLVAAHPGAARCLAEVVERFGMRSLGTPELSIGDRIEPEEDRVWLELSVHLVEGEDDRRGRVEFVFAIDDRGPKLVSLELRSAGADRPVLHLSPAAELESELGCGAKDEDEELEAGEVDAGEVDAGEGVEVPPP